jgi:hypothetical protein
MDLFEFTDEVTEWNDDTVIAGFCRDSASEMRVFQTQSGSEYCTEEKEFCDISTNSPYKTDCNDLTDSKM